jgi:lipopolysaccharide/colanic/teichoic acid biosynthesis glycosyltransferase/glycosyltransferase involved in cell wall biosynthesis
MKPASGRVGASVVDSAGMPKSVAIVHDWLMSMRGGERVAEVLCRIFPQADLFALTWDPARLSPALAQRRATTSAIHCVAHAPFMSGRFRALLPLFPLAVESFNLDRYALVVSSSHCVAIGAIAPPTALHVAYVHSTLRYVREAQPTYEASVPGGHLGRTLFRGTAHYLRRWESAAAARPDVLIANSTYTRQRINRYYRRDALVIAPPVETRRFERAAATVRRPEAGAPFLMVSALVPNKRVDLAVRAFQGRPERLVVVGEGPARTRLERLAGPNVTLLPRVGDAELDALFAGCKALLHTGIDDFGMVMVEALAAGRPVLACAEGGALDIVRDGETGLLIEKPTVESVRAALDRFALVSNRFDSGSLQRFARRFDEANFERQFSETVEDAWRKRRNGASNGRLNGHASSNGVPLRRHVDPTAAASPQDPPAGLPRPDEITHAKESGLDEAAHPRGAKRRFADHSPFGRAAECFICIARPACSLAVPASRAAKRVADIMLSASALAVTGPLLAALAVAIPLDSRGPPLFCQRRPGLDQRPFTLIKLRTMDEAGRVTRVGRLLRPTGIDELPQLWNVLKGEMSLIGPRPEVADRAERFERELPGYRARHLMPPGITGWAQVNGQRGDIAIVENRLQFDIQYIREWSLALDCRILLRTFSTVIEDTVRELRA